MASRSVTSHEFLRYDLGDSKTATGIATLGNSTSTVQCRRSQYATGILLPGLSFPIARRGYRPKEEPQAPGDRSGLRSDLERLSHSMASRMEDQHEK